MGKKEKYVGGPIPCAKGIWKKFGAGQKDLWEKLNKRFFNECIILSESSHECKLREEQWAILAHNMACEAVWGLTTRGM
jgi:hypothetical protein